MYFLTMPFTLRKPPSSAATSVITSGERKGVDVKCCVKAISFIVILIVQITLFLLFFWKNPTSDEAEKKIPIYNI